MDNEIRTTENDRTGTTTEEHPICFYIYDLAWQMLIHVR